MLQNRLQSLIIQVVNDIMDEDMEFNEDEEFDEENGDVENNYIADTMDEEFPPHEYFLDKEDYNLNKEDVLSMEFDSLVEAQRFYTTHAHGMGFSVRKNSSRKNQLGEVIAKQFCCSREGHRRRENRDIDNRQRNQKSETRIGCEARIWVNYNVTTNKWNIGTFIAEHNHDMVEPDQKCYLRSNRHVDDGSLKETLLMKSSGVRTCEAMKYLSIRAGGANKVGFTRKDLYNKLHKHMRSTIKAGDAQSIILFLENKKRADSGLMYRHTVDDKNRLEHIFWTDYKAMMDYQVFGDVIAFDTTYKKNSYNMPLLCLIGVNNHNQTIVFGFALLSNETTETFKWVLQVFVELMGNKRPKSVVTDGDRSMHNAIEEILPDATHRLCVWHLARNANSNVKVAGFLGSFKRCMMSWWTEDEFETAWSELLDDYQLHDHPWVVEKYRTKRMWAQAYLSGHFFGTMKSTSRCEGLHSYLKRFTNRSGTLLEFMHAINLAVTSIRDLEVEADFRAMHSRPVTSTDGLQMLEAHGASIYTKNAFCRFQKELRGEHLYSCPSGCFIWHGNRAYNLSRYGRSGKQILVVFDVQSQYISCICRKMETEGIPCRHAVSVMKMENLVKIPDSMISERWKINARDKHQPLIKSQLTTEDVEMFRQASIRVLCNKVANIASRSTEAYNQAMKSLRELLGNLMVYQEPPVESELSRPMLTQVVGDPVKVQSKGRKKIKDKAKKKVYSCGKCKREGHSVRTCPDKVINIGRTSDKVSADCDSDRDSSDDDIFDMESLSSIDLNEDAFEHVEMNNDDIGKGTDYMDFDLNEPPKDNEY